MTNCGPGGSGTESCCTSPGVTGGTFDEFYGLDGGPLGGGNPATVSSFRLDKYLVTVGRFRQFVKAWNKGKGYLPPIGSGKHTYLNGGQGLANNGPGGGYESGWNASYDERIQPELLATCGYGTWTASAGRQENLPINCLNWFEAYAFCIWDGGFLPGQVEWEYAAAGGSQQREYPWGSTAPGTSNQYAIYGCYYADAGGVCVDTQLAPVGTAVSGAGLWGQLDMVGEVWEWNVDLYGRPLGPCDNCAYLTGGVSRASQGCSYWCPAEDLPLGLVSQGVPTDRDTQVGLRCARAP